MNSPDWTFEYTQDLLKKLKKLKKKNFFQFEPIMKKREDVKEKIKANPDYFKNLSKDLKEFRRVHIDSHFVLVFKVDKERKVIIFEDYDHHDKIYLK